MFSMKFHWHGRIFLSVPNIYISKCVSYLFNSLPHNPWFPFPWEGRFLKTLWEKEKMLVTSIFSFSHIVFYHVIDRNNCLISLWFFTCKCFQFDLVKDYSILRICGLVQIFFVRDLGGLVVKCLTRNPGVLGSSRTGPSWFLGQDTSEPRSSIGETQERPVSCRRDMTEILSKAA